MSRIGKKPLNYPANVKVSAQGRKINVEAGSNKLAFEHRPEVNVKIDDKTRTITVERKGDDRQSRALHGTTRAILANMVEGVTKGFVKELELVGVGWSAKVAGLKVELSVGYADTRIVEIPTGVKVEIAGPKIKVSGADAQKVGQVAAEIRAHRPPEPYNGKGIKYLDERIVRKAGKAFAGGGAA